MRDNEAYEYALATIGGEQYGGGEGDSPLSIAAGMTREALRAVWTASGGDMARLRIVFMRACGMTLEEIAAEMDCSYQAIQGRLSRMATRHPAIAAYVRSGNPLDLYTEITDNAEKQTDARGL